MAFFEIIIQIISPVKNNPIIPLKNEENFVKVVLPSDLLLNPRKPAISAKITAPTACFFRLSHFPVLFCLVHFCCSFAGWFM